MLCGACSSSGETDTTAPSGGQSSGGQSSGGQSSGGQPPVPSGTGGATPVDGTGGSSPTDGETHEERLAKAGWKMVWADEFDGPAIDSANWTHEVNCWGGGNNEQQCYVDDAKNSFIQDGMLHIVALADNPTGSEGESMPHSSARLVSRDKADFKYGRFEARIKLPVGQGLWPAFWMLPSDDQYGGWAASGEIDIMEAVNLSPSANLVHGTLHYGGSWPMNTYTGEAYEPPAYAGATFYKYAVEWEEGAIHWFVDDVHYSTQTEWYTLNSDFPAPFDQKFFLILNVAVGGNWPGSPNAATSFPQEMVVDYVRAYECSQDTATGQGCTQQTQ